MLKHINSNVDSHPFVQFQLLHISSQHQDHSCVEIIPKKAFYSIEHIFSDGNDELTTGSQQR